MFVKTCRKNIDKLNILTEQQKEEIVGKTDYILVEINTFFKSIVINIINIHKTQSQAIVTEEINN